MFDDKDRLIIALLRQLGGTVKVSYPELEEADRCILQRFPAGLDFADMYSVYHPDDSTLLHGKPRLAKRQTDPKAIIAWMMLQAGEDVAYFNADDMAAMCDYVVEVMDQTAPLRTRVRVWAKSEGPPGHALPEAIKAHATRQPPAELLQIEDAEVVNGIEEING